MVWPLMVRQLTVWHWLLQRLLQTHRHYLTLRETRMPCHMPCPCYSCTPAAAAALAAASVVWLSVR